VSWWDDFAVMDSVLSSAPKPSGGYTTFNDRFAWAAPPKGKSKSTTKKMDWSSLASGAMAPRLGAPVTGKAGLAKAAVGPVIDRININYPYSSTRPGSPYAPSAPDAPRSTKGDLVGSFGDATGSVVNQLNLGNFIPYFMERVNVLAGDLADADIPLVSGAAAGAEWATDRFIDGVNAVSQVVGPMLDAVPTWIRDEQLKGRAQMYRSLAAGETVDQFGTWLSGVSAPLAHLGQMASIVSNPVASGIHYAQGRPVNMLRDLTGEVVSDQARQIVYWQDELKSAIDPDDRLTAQQMIQILRATVDLPDSVKFALEANPGMTDDDVDRLLDEAPEGKLWSYQPGVGGLVQNAANPIAMYLLQARLGGSIVGTARTAALTSGKSALMTGAAAVGQGSSIALRVTTAATASGVGISGVNAVMGGIARYVGNEEAIKWWDNANRTTEFSDDPMVQLATGFMVNPFAAAKNLKQGVVALKHGLVDVPTGIALGNRLKQFYTTDDALHDMTRRMFKLGSKEQAAAFLDETELRPYAHDMIVGNALDIVLDRLPKSERMTLNATFTDPVERAAVVLQRYGRQAMDLIQKDPDLVAARFHTFDWQKRMMAGPFEPYMAAKIARDYRRNVDLTYDLRQEQNLVVGYRESFPPTAQTLAREALDRNTTPEGTVSLSTFQALQVDFPVLGRFWGGIIRADGAPLQRADVDRVLEAASVDWAVKAKRNPVKAATGKEPVLDPESPTIVADEATAFGTSPEAIEAIKAADLANNSSVDLVRDFLRDKGVGDDLDVGYMTPAQVYQRAQQYLDEVGKPWRDGGVRQRALTKEIQRTTDEIAHYRAMPKSAERDVAIAEVEREIHLLRTLADDADAVTPFSQSVAIAQANRRFLTRINKMKPGRPAPLEVETTAPGPDVAFSVRAKDVLDAGVPLDPGPYVYHGSPVANIDSIATKGLLRRPHDGADVVFVADSAPALMAFLPRRGPVALFRIKRADVKVETTLNDLGEPVLGQFHVYSDIPASAIEFRAADGTWKPIAADAMTAAERGELWNYLASSGKSVEGSADDLLARAKASLDEPTPALDRAMRDRAERVVEAREALERLDLIQTQMDTLGAPDLHRIFNKVEGRWMYSGGLPSLSRAFRARMSTGLANTGHKGAAREAQLNSDYDLWRFLLRHEDSAAIRETLTPAQRKMVDRVDRELSGRFPKGADEYATRWADQEGIAAAQDDSWTEVASRLLGEREAIMGGRSVAILRSVAGARLPLKFAQEAAERGSAWMEGPLYDPEWVAVVHPRNISRLAVAADAAAAAPDAAAFAVVRRIIDEDDILRAKFYGSDLWRQVDSLGGWDAMDADLAPLLSAYIRRELIPADFVPPTPGVVGAESALDQAIRNANTDAVQAEIAQARTQSRTIAPLSVPRGEVAKVIEVAKARRLATRYRRRMAQNDGDMVGVPDEAIMADPVNRTGMDVLSILNHTIIGTRPATIRGVLSLLDEIENGNASRLGIGTAFQAEGQRVARALLDDAVRKAEGAAQSTRRGPEPMTIAMTTADDTAVFRDAIAADPQREGYGYHVTRADSFPAIQERGLAPRDPRNGDDIGVYFGESSRALDEYVPVGNRGGNVLLRASQERLEPTGQNFDELISRDTIYPDEIEFLGTDGAWHPLLPSGPRLKPWMEPRKQMWDEDTGARTAPPQPRRPPPDLTAYRRPPAADDVGVLSQGAFDTSDGAIAAAMDDLITFDGTNPLGTLQYGLKKRPKGAVVIEWSKVPGLAEELMSKRFQPFEERVFTTHVRQAYNYVFGPRSNGAVRAQAKANFIERTGREGITPSTADAIWSAWQQRAHDSRTPLLRVSRSGRRTYEAGDNPLYADINNIPNSNLDAVVHGFGTEKGVLRELSDMVGPDQISLAELARASEVNFARLFRESTSFTRGHLADSRIPLGRALADAYGAVAHNSVVTTLYYWFRFSLDIRYHAMNFFEAQILYYGRAGLRKGEIDEGLLGQTEGYLRKMDDDPVSNTGYSFSRDRMAWAYRTFLKEQPDALRGGLKGLAAEDPALMQKAMEQLARTDPQLRDMIEAMGDNPEKYLGELDAWHRKMLANIDEADDAVTIDDAIAAQMRDTPELQEVFGLLAQKNKDLWGDIRGTFYGNPNRSRAERFLNSYLLFWPLSYQIKSTKWFMRVLGDRMGGLPTNALGAVMLNEAAEGHNRLLATDPEYRDWFEKHDTLVFVAQMMFPVSFESTGVSLNPILRSIFFDRTKAGMEVGPIYTFTDVIVPAAKEAYVSLYPTIGDLPGFDGVYRALTGRREPDMDGSLAP